MKCGVLILVAKTVFWAQKKKKHKFGIEYLKMFSFVEKFCYQTIADTFKTIL